VDVGNVISRKPIRNRKWE